MNEDYQKRIDGYLGAIESAANKAGEFVEEQTPLLAQEYLAWEFWSSLAACVALFVLGVTLFAAIFVSWKRIVGDETYEDHPEVLVVAAILLAASILPLGFSAENGFRALKVSVAPRVVLMEKVMELSK